ncbi:MAG: glycosyltransferase [Candidatus Omnitrophica bacterium]|nr:glycosyltransferase [Candidatus Omnitrophota bacterium]
MKVALVHDWLIHMRGGEKVLEALAELYPEAVIHTLFYDKNKISETLKKRKVKTSFLQYLPGIKKYYRWLLPVLPWVVRTLQIKPCDIVISSSHCVAKGVRIPKGARHYCYCHTPMRYAWGYEEDYFGKFPRWIRPLIAWILSSLRKWDFQVNASVDRFIANSENVRRRIEVFYHREAEVIYPPVDLTGFYPDGEPKNYYLVVSAFVPYKKVDLVIDAFQGLDRELWIVGSGPLEEVYRRKAKETGGSKVRFLGVVQAEELRKLYSEARAVIFPTDEDFGIVPLEAQACGTPVIAFKKGGALESVMNGLFFEEQSPGAIREKILDFETKTWERGNVPGDIRDFDKPCFKEEMLGLIEEDNPVADADN